MAGKNSKLGGYTNEFIKPLAEEYRCKICELALRSPFQTECGHRFCENCIKQVIYSGPKMCPEDKTALTLKKIFPDVFCKRRMLELECFCSGKDRGRGCNWTGLLKFLEEHLSLSCPKFPLACPKRCQRIVDRSEMVKHLAHDCPYADASCPMTGHCDYKGSRAELHNHLSVKNFEHASMVEDKISSMKSDIEMVQTATTTIQEQQQVLKNQVTKELVSIGNDVATLHARFDRYLNTHNLLLPLRDENGEEGHAEELSE